MGIIEDITGEGLIQIHQKNKFVVGDEINIMDFNGDNHYVTVDAMFDERMHPVQSAPHPKQLLYLKVDGAKRLSKGMVIRSRHCEA